MTQPNNFIVTTDFPTSKNDSIATGDVTIPNGFVVTGGNTAQASINVTSGTIGATSRARIASSKNFMNWYVTQAITYQRVGTVGGSPFAYNIVAFVRRSSPTTVTFQVLLKNESASPLTVAPGDETIYFYSNQFVAPYA